VAIIGAHMLLYTSDPDGVRAVLRDAFGLRHVDAGGGWLIFRMPPSEVGVHPAEPGAPNHQVSFMCDDITATVAQLRARGVVIKGEPHREQWGTLVTAELPGGCNVTVYQPHHPLAIE
jgi:hypothetical protein